MGAYNRQRTITCAWSRDELAAQLAQLGVREGMVLEVHSSLKSLGFVIGGARTVVDALMAAVGADGTLVMPLQDSDNTDPASWCIPPADRALWDKIRSNMPPCEQDASDFPYMGAVVGSFIRRRGTIASKHPNCAFAAYGKYARLIVDKQPLPFALSDQSPLGVMYQLPSYILLLGVGYERCTGMHLAEYRSNVQPVMIQGAATGTAAHPQWQKYLDIDMNSDEFAAIGQAMEAKKMVAVGRIGAAHGRLFKFTEAVDFATAYLQDRYVL